MTQRSVISSLAQALFQYGELKGYPGLSITRVGEGKRLSCAGVAISMPEVPFGQLLSHGEHSHENGPAFEPYRLCLPGMQQLGPQPMALEFGFDSEHAQVQAVSVYAQFHAAHNTGCVDSFKQNGGRIVNNSPDQFSIRSCAVDEFGFGRPALQR